MHGYVGADISAVMRESGEIKHWLKTSGQEQIFQLFIYNFSKIKASRFRFGNGIFTISPSAMLLFIYFNYTFVGESERAVREIFRKPELLPLIFIFS